MNGDYSLAVHALVYLDHRATNLPSQILADNICTNAARVRKVMRPLAAAGLVFTKEGPEGGYALAKPAEAITLRDVAEAAGATFVDVNWTPGDIHEDCLVSSSMGAVMDGIYASLNESCLTQLERITVHDITSWIFNHGDGPKHDGPKHGDGRKPAAEPAPDGTPTTDTIFTPPTTTPPTTTPPTTATPPTAA